MSAALALNPRLIAPNDSRRRAPAVVRRVHDRHHAPPAPSRVPVSVNGSTVGTYAYDPFRLTSLTRGNGVVTNYGYDPLWRLRTLATTLSGAGNTDNISLGFNYSMASQLKSRAMTTAQALYTYVPITATTTYTINGLNQGIYASNTMNSLAIGLMRKQDVENPAFVTRRAATQWRQYRGGGPEILIRSREMVPALVVVVAVRPYAH